MTERERLIELLDSGTLEVSDNYGMPNSAELADYLLKNGVIVLPCRADDSVYFEENGKIVCRTVDSVSYEELSNNDEYTKIEGQGFSVIFDDVGKLIYRTREEAEKALEGA